MDLRYQPRDWRQKFFYPFFLATRNSWTELVFRDVRLALCYIAIVFIAGYLTLKWIHRPRPPGKWLSADTVPVLFLAAFFVLSYVAWQRLFCIYRYACVLEFLAPALLALTVATFLRRPLQVVVLSLLINAGICATTFMSDLGRLKPFDDHLLDVKVPAIPDLDHYLVLMAGDEPTGYIATQFPAATRFAKLYANFYRPTFNPELDGIVHEYLSKYDASRMLAYVSEPAKVTLMRSTLRYFGLQLVEENKWDLGGSRRSHGFLYEVTAIPGLAEADPKEQKAPAPVVRTAPSVSSGPVFLESKSVGLSVQPDEAVAGRGVVVWRVSGLQTAAIDLMYTLNDKAMPPIRFWELDKDYKIEAVTTEATPKGLYHIIAVRDSFDPRSNTWFRVDVSFLLR